MQISDVPTKLLKYYTSQISIAFRSQISWPKRFPKSEELMIKCYNLGDLQTDKFEKEL